MGKFRVTIRTRFGEISVEGDSSKEILELVKEALTFQTEVNIMIPEERVTPPIIPTALAPPSVPKKELEGIIEVTADGRPHVTVSPEKLAAKEVIGLLLYWKYPAGFSTKELTELVSLSWKTVDQPRITATIADLKGLVIKEGPKGKYVYLLSGAGKSWVENDLLPKLRGELK